MPSKSKKQARLMRAAAHDPEFARKVGVPQSVAREFVKADKRKADKRKADKRKAARKRATRKRRK